LAIVKPLIAIDRNVQYLSFIGFWVGDFIVGTMVFGIVLAMGKIGLFGLKQFAFVRSSLTAIAHPIAPIALTLNFTEAKSVGLRG